MNPLTLRQRAAEMTCPQALLVVLEFARLASTDRELAHYVDYVAAGWQRVSPEERFFLDAVDHAISRQQALADLKRCPDLALQGHGRGAVWK